MSPRSHSPASRRRFLTAAGGTGGFLLSGFGSLSAAERSISETDHFYYYTIPAGELYVDTQRGNRAFGFRDGHLYLSEDCGATWPVKIAFPGADDITFSCFLDNGNLVFATSTKIYLSEDNLKSFREITVTDSDGSDYRPHTPVDPAKPGSYFYSLDGIHTHQVEGKEMMIWGNYCNVRTGAVPVNIYYSTDQGRTIKIAYSFGQNPAFQQPGAEPENFLGNPDNPVVCRHIHSVTYNPNENAFYACTGDLDRKIGTGLECHWLRGTYDSENDNWDWKVIVSSDANSRFKSGGLNFVDGEVYWVADANGPKTIRETYDRGVFKCKPADIPHKEKHTMIFPAQYEIAVMTIEDDFIVIPEYGNANPCDCGILYSPDLGKTWGQYDLKELGDRSGVRVNPRNSEGWFRMCLKEKWMNRAELLFLKPKQA